jgi:hypothetical protein
MKKYFLIMVLILTSMFSITSKAVTSYQVYVHDIKTDKVQYKVGDTVSGNFNISNLSEIAQSDIYYTISTGPYSEETKSVLGEYGMINKVGPIYIKGNSKDTIPFSYILPSSVSGNAAIQISITLKDGTFVGQSDYQVFIEGESTKKTINVFDVNLSIPGFKNDIPASAGPTVYKDDKINLGFITSTSSKKYIVNPTLKLYDRVDNPDALKREIKLDPMTISKDIVRQSVYLPVDLDSLVYYGVLSFASDEIEVSDISFRYIISGPIATVRNITTNTLELKKDQDFITNVTYGGQPLDEYRPEKQIKSGSTTITVIAMNEKGEIIDEVTQSLDLSSSSRSTVLSMKSKVDAKSMSFSSVIKDTNGKILDEYKTSLPTEDQVKNQESYVKNTKILIWYAVGALLLILIMIGLFIFFKRRGKKISKVMSIIFMFGILMLGLFMYKNVMAYEVYVTNVADSSVRGVDTDMGISVISPLPPSIRIYAPGESFKISFVAWWGDCNNRPYSFSTHVPKVEKIYNMGVLSPKYKQKSWWIENGIQLIYGQTIANNGALATSSSASVITRSGSWGGHQNARYTTTAEYTYNAPTTPGFHDIYFFSIQEGGSVVSRSYLIKETICVGGAMLCPNEVAIAPTVSISVDNIQKNTAKVNWIYTNTLPQRDYQVQIATSSAFLSGVVNITSSNKPTGNATFSVRDITFDNLIENTQYYARVRSMNSGGTWSPWSSTSFRTLASVQTQTCACNNTRTLTCTTDGTITSTTPNSSQCAFSSYCSVSTTTTNTTFNFGPAGNRIGGVKYEHASGISVTKNGPVDYSYIYSIPKVNGTQSLTVTSTDLSDSSSDTKTCSVTNSPTTTPSTTTSTTTPKITITKTPKITLNKGGTCTLDWNITDRSSDMTCILSGTDNTTTTLPDSSSGTSKSGPLQQNTKYTIKCTGDTPTKNVSASTICRVNPTIGEI